MRILSSRTVLLWVGIVASETFSLTKMIQFRLYSSWIKVDDIKSRCQEQHVKLSSKLNSLTVTKWALYSDAVKILKQASYLCVPSSLFCFSGKVTSKNLLLVSCFMKSNFCWQSAEIRLPYHLGSIYAKWLVLKVFFKNLEYNFLVERLKTQHFHSKVSCQKPIFWQIK